MFYMNMGVLNEGEQAEAYKRRKEEEKDKAIENKYGHERQKKMAVIGTADGRSKAYYANPSRGIKDYDADKHRIVSKAEKNGLDYEKASQHEKKMQDNALKASEITRREAERRNEIAKASGKLYDYKFDQMYPTVMDATAKHLRKHPEKLKEDCGIFESVEII